MVEGLSEYSGRSAILLSTAQNFRTSLRAPERRREFAIDELLAATRRDAAPDVVLRFASEPGVPRPPSPRIDPREGLCAVVLDLQSANLLISAGVAAQETGAARDASLFDEARRQLSTTRDELLASVPAAMGFAATLAVKSDTLDAAKGSFRGYSDELLNEIVAKCWDAISAAFKELKHLDPTEIIKALDKIGQAVPIVAEGGRLVRAGIDKLKRAIEAIAALFGIQPYDKVKKEIGGLWNSFTSGEHSHALLRAALGVPVVEQQIAQKLGRPRLDVGPVDRASNALAPLAVDFTRNINLLNALIFAIGLAAKALVFFHFAVPWLPLALAAGYVSAIGVVVLLGCEYAGGRQILHWVGGVDQIAEAIPAEE